MKLGEGAEASIYLEKGIVDKKRRRKSYRIKELDDKLRTFRTRREVKILKKLADIGVLVPKVLSFSDKTANIEMSYIEGDKLRDVLTSDKCRKYGKLIGRSVAKMHANNIIHGDLTTSNMIVSSGKLYFIDFGLGFFSDKVEDKAVDLHLLRQALRSSHSKVADNCFKAVIAEYKNDDVINRLELVESRGRYKGKKLFFR